MSYASLGQDGISVMESTAEDNEIDDGDEASGTDEEDGEEDDGGSGESGDDFSDLASSDDDAVVEDESETKKKSAKKTPKSKELKESKEIPFVFKGLYGFHVSARKSQQENIGIVDCFASWNLIERESRFKVL